jgi:DNA-binding NtrC family response regulator
VATIQIIDDEPGIRKLLGIVLKGDGHTVIEAATGPEGVAVYDAYRPDLILCDVVMPDMDGIAVLQQIKTLNPSAPVVMITGHRSTEQAIRAMSLGASEYLMKPLDTQRTIRLIRQILESLDSQETEDEQSERGNGLALIGKTDAMYEVFKLIGRVAGQPSTVLILGESGTGKELVARAIHSYSPRHAGPFVALNCAAIPESLLESELFGHERGAFTGADSRQPGRFELADSGTLFLDEIGDMSPVTQAKLLRVLQDQEFYRLGGRQPIRTTARILAATNRNLRADVASGRFREDLFYRLSGVVVQLPPLRERRDDIPLLVEYFLRRSARSLGRSVRGLAPDALEMLLDYRWPGNVRELANVIQQAVLQTPGPTILPVQFADLIPLSSPSVPKTRSSTTALFDPEVVRAHVIARLAENDQQILEPLVTAYERAVITAVLEQCQGNVSLAAKYLGIHRVTLKSKLPETPTTDL